MAGSFKAQFDPADGTGDWSINIPADADMHDVLALGPVIEGIKGYLAPTVAPDQPVSYQLVERIDPDRDWRGA